MKTWTMNRRSLACAGGLIVASGLALACTEPPFEVPPAYTVSGTVSGLAGSGLVLRNNGGDDLPVSANGPVTFATPLDRDAAYSVTVFAQPSSPAQRCAVTGGSGTMASANVTTVAIVCFTNAYTVGGTVSGLVGSGLVLRDNGGDDLPVSANGPVTFATPLTNGASYSVTVFTQPASPAQTCGVTGGSGTMAHANVTTVAIACVTDAYTVGGTVSGLVGSGLVLLNNDGDNLEVVGNGPVTFATPLSSGATYSVRVSDEPVTPDQTCVVTDGSGTIAHASITTVAIVCVTNTGTGAVRVTALTAGLDAPAIDTVLFDWQSGSDSATVVPANGAASFDLAPGAHTVSLTVAQNCTVTSPNPVMVTVTSGANINIAFSVTCVASGTLRVTVATTGPDVPATYTVVVDPTTPLRPYSAIVSPNGTVSFAVASGDHTVFLQAASNCTVKKNSVSVTVVAGARTDVPFSVICEPLGTIKVTMATTGTNAPATYMVRTTEVWSYAAHTAFVPSNGTISLHVLPGSYTVKLTVPTNCTLSAHTPNPVSVSVASGATTTIARSVTCAAPATLRVTASTTGPNAPETYSVGIDPAGYWGYTYYLHISSNGTLSTILPPGSHTVNLLVPLNCTVSTPNNVSATLTPGAITHLGFTVACQ